MSMFDLHMHSTHSDGKLSVTQLTEIIKEKKLEYCALSDHNTVSGVSELIEALKNTEIKVIPAVELTAKYHNNEIHVLAYDFDIEMAAKIIKERNEIVNGQRIKEMKLAIELSRKAGLKVTEGLSLNEKQPVTLTIALDICDNSDNQSFFVKNFSKEFTTEDVFYEYQAPGKVCHVERSGVTVEWIIQQFKGIAQDLIIAHPFVSVSVVALPLSESEIKDLLDLGLTGIEVYHNRTSVEQIKLLEKIVNERFIHYTGGSDFHGKTKDTPISQYASNCFVSSFLLTNHKSDYPNKL